MQVFVDPPRIVGDTVTFRWTQSEPNPFQHDNGFFFRYEGIELNQFMNALFYEMFLGLQLRIFAAYTDPVEIVLPEPVSPQTVAFWQAYHRADNTTISPLAVDGTYSPWKTRQPPGPRCPIGIFFGGGKDSSLATCVLSEIFGADQIVLFQLVSPFRPTLTERTRLERRQRDLMLLPMREGLGVATQQCWTDYIAQQKKSQWIHRPHLELYTVGFLPLFLHWGTSFVTTSFPWTVFPISRLPDDTIWFRYAQSRPEVLSTQSTHYYRTLDTEITLTNVNLLFSSGMAFRLLVERYPRIMPHIVMCVHAEIGQRWCYSCAKCTEYAISTLVRGIVDPRFDYNRVLTTSRMVEKVVEYVERGVERSAHGNVPWQHWLCHIGKYTGTCHAVALAQFDLIAPQLTTEAMSNVLILKAAFGNTIFPNEEKIPAQAVDLLGHETARQMARLASEYFDIADRLDGTFRVGQREIEYDFSVRMPTATGQLAHTRA